MVRLVPLVLSLDDFQDVGGGVGHVLGLHVVALGVERLGHRRDGEVLLDRIERAHDILAEPDKISFELGLPGDEFLDHVHLDVNLLVRGVDAIGQRHLDASNRLLGVNLRVPHVPFEQREVMHPGLDLRLERGVNLVALLRQLVPGILVSGVELEHGLGNLPPELVLP